ncbi:MAG: hypothetical protein IH991_05220 [Planctomycetes bacterium]|nr:hypothetical protein [Planctomycetota bacterium]
MNSSETQAATDPPLTNRARTVLQLAERRARRLKYDSVYSQHVLLGIAQQGLLLHCQSTCHHH